jgi:glycolate oxidase FAD binding subunit
VLRAAAADGSSVRFRGGGTKFDWGNRVGAPDVLLSTKRLDRIVEHNAADLTAVLEAGVRLADAQQAFGEAGQMFAVDPHLGKGQAATIGGIVATGDSGPLRHRYGGPRDQLLGMTVALSDGVVAKSGGKVIKNVAGYDLAKLFTGSFGTLGLITQVAVRLHPLGPQRVSAVGFGDDPDALQEAAVRLSHRPFQLDSLDVEWPGRGGRVMARCAGSAPQLLAREAVHLMAKAGLSAETVDEDAHLWEGQQGAQESTMVRVSALPSELSRIIRIVERLQSSLVARAGLGICWIRIPSLPPDDVVSALEDLRFSLSPLPCVILDAPVEVREKVDVWGISEGREVELMRRVKANFDPAGVCNPGLFVGGI